MQPSELRNLSEAELDVRTRELEEELFMLQLRRSTSQLENPMKLRAVRRDLASSLRNTGIAANNPEKLVLRGWASKRNFKTQHIAIER